MNDYSLMTVDSDNNPVFPASSIPASVISAVIAEPKLNAIGVAGFVRSSNQILKADVVTFSTRSLLQLENVSSPFVVIAAKDLFIEIPPNKAETAKIARAPDAQFGDLIGPKGQAGSTGWTSGKEDGAHGGKGGEGGTGITGATATLPDLYIFFERINTSNGNPSTGGLLTVLANGVNGGQGGQGGVGGSGGNGATGTPSSSTGYSCSAGPGRGGDGGPRGSGGRGGNGGTGGRGGSVFLVGPKAEWGKAAFFEVIQSPGKGGAPGAPGVPGEAGYPGGGGVVRFPCNGRGPGNPGGPAVPNNLGPGDPGSDGAQGTKALIDRSNADLF
jgi:hypothetical protein